MKMIRKEMRRLRWMRVLVLYRILSMLGIPKYLTQRVDKLIREMPLGI